MPFKRATNCAITPLWGDYTIFFRVCQRKKMRLSLEIFHQISVLCDVPVQNPMLRIFQSLLSCRLRRADRGALPLGPVPCSRALRALSSIPPRKTGRPFAFPSLRGGPARNTSLRLSQSPSSPYPLVPPPAGRPRSAPPRFPLPVPTRCALFRQFHHAKREGLSPSRLCVVDLRGIEPRSYRVHLRTLHA